MITSKLRKETVRKVIKHLEQHGLSVYGSNYQFVGNGRRVTGLIAYGGCRDYDTGAAIQLIDALDTGVPIEEAEYST